MNSTHLVVARELLHEAAALWRWSQAVHPSCAADIEAAPGRAALARAKARAAFALLSSVPAKLPMIGSGGAENFQRLEKDFWSKISEEHNKKGGAPPHENSRSVLS